MTEEPPDGRFINSAGPGTYSKYVPGTSYNSAKYVPGTSYLFLSLTRLATCNFRRTRL